MSCFVQVQDQSPNDAEESLGCHGVGYIVCSRNECGDHL